MPQPLDASRDPEAVRSMFDRIAPRYDFANHLLSGGIDFLWRRRATQIVAKWQPARVLDLATGSGDLALAIARALPNAEVTGADFSAEMLAVARRKGLQRTVVADALALPFADRAFECATVAFGLRNMADWGAALREMARVLTPGGHVLVLDFSLPSGLLRQPYRFYLHHVLPSIAGFVTGHAPAYAYLGDSIEKFPRGETMLRLMEANGFQNAHATALSGGIAAIYTATCEG
jgi:demethylmenaquinone methyltransferase/2-methoxy-6-polyprenyl-1,4-benzoquinol methylase